MAGALVTCEACGRVTRLPDIQGATFRGNGRNIVVRCACGNEIEPVPRGDIVVSTVGGRLTWQALRTAASSVARAAPEELAELRDALTSLSERLDKRANFEALADEIASLNQGFGQLSAEVRKGSQGLNSEQVGLWLTVLIAFITMVLQWKATNAQTIGPEELERILREVVPAASAPAAPPALTRPAPAQLPKPARNAPCACGSGIKYKKCHGAPSAPPHGP